MKAIPKLERVSGTVRAPSSKSLTARALLLGAIAEGETRIVNPLDCDDARYMLDALRKVGYESSGSFKDGLVIGDRVSISANDVEIFVGNAGTAMRFLAGFLAFTPGRFILKGEARMHERPIANLVDPLAQFGCEIDYLERVGFPPLVIRGKRMRGNIDIAVDASVSSQFVSSLMMAGTTLAGGIRILPRNAASRPYIDLTAGILRAFGATIVDSGDAIDIKGGPLRLDRYEVEGDYSSASYWFAAAAACGGSVTVENLSSTSAQGDRGFVEVLRALGCVIEERGDRITVTGRPLGGGTFDCNAMPDIVPTLAAIAPAAGAPIAITNVANLRVKESDRLAVVAESLKILSVSVDERDDALFIRPGWSAAPAEIEPHGDHRIAMAFAIAGLARGNVVVQNEHVVSKSYPRFWRTLDELVASSKEP
jgi:3-phosphoshikimate 1-carboxyvinyltransferase